MSWRVARSQSCWYGINQPHDHELPDLARRKLAQVESRRSAAGRLSPDFNTRTPSSGAPPLASPASGVIKASAPKPVIFSRRSTAGSPKVSTRLCCKTPRRRLTSWRDSISCLLGKIVVKPHRVTIFVRRLLSRDRAASLMAMRTTLRPKVRFGSNRDLNPPVRHVRSTPRSRHSSDRPLCARSGRSETAAWARSEVKTILRYSDRHRATRRAGWRRNCPCLRRHRRLENIAEVTP
jgi:hypothetical protein